MFGSKFTYFCLVQILLFFVWFKILLFVWFKILLFVWFKSLGIFCLTQNIVVFVWWRMYSTSYYQLEEASPTAVNQFLSTLVNSAIGELQQPRCLDIEEVGTLYTQATIVCPELITH